MTYEGKIHFTKTQQDLIAESQRFHGLKDAALDLFHQYTDLGVKYLTLRELYDVDVSKVIMIDTLEEEFDYNSESGKSRMRSYLNSLDRELGASHNLLNGEQPSLGAIRMHLSSAENFLRWAGPYRQELEHSVNQIEVVVVAGQEVRQKSKDEGLVELASLFAEMMNEWLPDMTIAG